LKTVLEVIGLSSGAMGEKRSRLEVIVQTIFEVEAGEVIEDSSSGVRALGGINHTVISSNLTRDAQSCSTNDGTSVAGLLLAVNERVKRHALKLEASHLETMVKKSAHSRVRSTQTSSRV
jgi:hypothetical protein